MPVPIEKIEDGPEYLANSPEGELHRLYTAGFSLLPLGAGAEGKAPLMHFSGCDRFPVEHILGSMLKHGSRMYGIRLHSLVVLDLDDRDETLRAELERRFGLASVQVATPRGWHLYYRAPGGVLPNLHKEGLTVDVKSGANSYVVGPGSIRPSGARYEYLTKSRLGEIELKELAISAEHDGAIVGSRIPVGRRNDHLFRAALGLVVRAESLDVLNELLRIERDGHCEDPASVPNREVRAIAEWAWKKRLENSIFSARNSAFRVDCNSIDLLCGLHNASDAIALYVLLVRQHGHQPGKTFSLVHEAMRNADLTDLSRERFVAARRTLEQRGLLQKAANPVRGFAHTQYRLRRPLPQTIARIP